MKFSIIIPYYNGQGTIGRCLDSVYSQGLEAGDFEVLVVNDCSPDPAAVEAVEEYRETRLTPPNAENLHILTTEQNVRQGGARNLGVRKAKGEWIVCIDQDDYWEADTLSKVLEYNKECLSFLDMVMVDHYFHCGNNVKERQYAHNSDKIHSGIEFIKREEFTWAPWGYLYRRTFLIENNLKFEEHVRFEDADFVMRSISYAKAIRYCPISTVHYTVNVDSQTAIGRDTRDKVSQMMMHNHRMYKEYLRIKEVDVDAGNVIRQHALFAFKIGTYRFIWLGFKDISFVADKYLKGFFKKEDGFYLYFASIFPNLFSTAIYLTSPILRVIVKAKQKKQNIIIC